MKNALKFISLIFLLILGFILASPLQADNPIAQPAKSMTGSNVALVQGRVAPILWQCKIKTLEGDAADGTPLVTEVNTLVALGDVEFVGKQNYIVDGKIEV